ncbi:MAG TPA: DUF5658 family protein [Nitrososphaerales archaeon]|nr:DUF5658 family protein [Nitrososphaerales archaeon]
MEQNDGILSRREQYWIANERDKKWLGNLDLSRLDNILWPLYIAFICLNFLDLYTTSLALSNSLVFQERNILAAKLFAMNFQGFLFALLIKFAPAFPLFYAVFLGDPKNSHGYQIRLIKVSAIVALIIGDAFYVWVVLLNNIPVLLSGTIGYIQK